MDATRITVSFRAAGISGTEAEAILRKKFNIQVEMSDLYNIVAITTIGDNKEDYERFVYALKEIAETNGNKTGNVMAPATFYRSPEPCIMPWEAVYREKEQITAENSIGRICGEMIIPYPPGIPVLMPGEKITGEAYSYLKLCVKQGIKINGASDPRLEKIWVVK